MASKFKQVMGLWEPKTGGGKMMAQAYFKHGCLITVPSGEEGKEDKTISIPPGGKIILFKNDKRRDGQNDAHFNLVWVEPGEYQPGGGGDGEAPPQTDDLPF